MTSRFAPRSLFAPNGKIDDNDGRGRHFPNSVVREPTAKPTQRRTEADDGRERLPAWPRAASGHGHDEGDRDRHRSETPLIRSAPKRIFALTTAESSEGEDSFDCVSPIIAYLSISKWRGRGDALTPLCESFKCRPSQLLLCSVTRRRDTGNER